MSIDSHEHFGRLSETYGDDYKQIEHKKYPANRYRLDIIKRLLSDISPDQVLDVGCGTGVLSILSEKKGANLIDAIDIEKWCYENTLENLRLNNCKFINVYHGNINFVNKRKYDIILANINKNIIMKEIPIYTNSLRTGGQLIMSGFYDNDFNDINDKAKSLKLNFISKKKKNLWTAIHYLKS